MTIAGMEGAVDAKALRDAWNGWLSQKEWRTFGTLTFADVKHRDGSYGPPGAQKSMKAAQAFASELERLALEVFMVEETGSVNLRRHWHFLGRAREVSRHSDDLLIKSVTLWKHGFTKVEFVQGQAGAVGYTTKYVTKSGASARFIWIGSKESRTAF